MYQPLGGGRRLRKNEELTPKIGSHRDDLGGPRQGSFASANPNPPTREGNHRISFEKQQQQVAGGEIGGFAGLGNNNVQYGRRSSANGISRGSGALPTPLPLSPTPSNQQQQQQGYYGAQQASSETSITGRGAPGTPTPPLYGRRAQSDGNMAQYSRGTSSHGISPAQQQGGTSPHAEGGGGPISSNPSFSGGAEYTNQHHLPPIGNYQVPRPPSNAGGYAPSGYHVTEAYRDVQASSPQHHRDVMAQYGRRAQPPPMPSYFPTTSTIDLQPESYGQPVNPSPAPPVNVPNPASAMGHDIERTRAERARAFQKEVEAQMLEARRVKEEEKRKQKEEDRLLEERVRKANEELAAKEKAEREREIKQKQEAEEARFAPKTKQKKLIDMPPIQDQKPKEASALPPVQSPPPPPPPTQPMSQLPQIDNGYANNNFAPNGGYNAPVPQDGGYSSLHGYANQNGPSAYVPPPPQASNGYHDQQFSMFNGQQQHLHHYGPRDGGYPSDRNVDDSSNMGYRNNSRGNSPQLDKRGVPPANQYPYTTPSSQPYSQGYSTQNISPSPNRNLALYPPSPQRGYQEGEGELDCEQDFIAVFRR